MKKRGLVILALALVVIAGCGGGPRMSANVQLMNAEKRALEDELYALEFDFQDALKEVKRLRQENERLRAAAGGSVEEPRRSTPRSRGSAEPGSDLMPPMIDEGAIEPRIEMPSNSPPAGVPRSNSTPQSPPQTRPPSRPETPAGPPLPPSAFAPGRKMPVAADTPNRTLSLDPADPRVTHIFLNQLLTGGTDFDRQPGDDGIVVVIEPRNRDEAFVPLAGPISVLVLDPAKSAEESRIVARWDIAANEAQQLLQNTASSRGIHLRLPWPGSPPTTNRLHLYVRYMTVDNRDLRADRDIFLNLPGQFSQRWTPRAATREVAASRPSSETIPASHTTTDPPPDALPTARPEWRPDR